LLNVCLSPSNCSHFFLPDSPASRVQYSSGASEAEQSQISPYLFEMRDGSFANTVTALEFWQQRQAKYDKRRCKLLMARGARVPTFWTVVLTILLSPHFCHKSPPHNGTYARSMIVMSKRSNI